MRRFICILQFLTRLPLPFKGEVDEEFHKGILYFPLVGGVLGLCYGGIAFVSIRIFPAFISSLIILLSMVLLTGGLHLDGVGDTFDGLYSYRDKARILEIMKDSRLGTNALLAIFFVLLFKLGFIYEAIVQGALWRLWIMPIMGRWLLVNACYKTQSPREKGMGNLFIGKASLFMLVGATTYTLLVCGGILSIWKLPLKFYGIQVGVMFFLFLGLKGAIYSVYRKIDGLTGDILGAICEMGELMYLVFIYIGIQVSQWV
ncbi:adenosylcobinamide-GDP ribazoletransferase [Sporanaerobium hydrogeniformans]|uniref:Adenosylcobinamide-GDP ribazoletransferase n=1 Tax=Sporanaerobium hydrogeniformans TaxID=3072179 RepID=A0AC61DHH6_9FIRM|nr:adenosylcobinamide-GDP ribazoletransferase [Sporanaerobium hydrogeniformans]PHV72297.1 adenosylcobinamide-GDP ribazoletransferase [Sporanaerobium hydrogeniformans]